MIVLTVIIASVGGYVLMYRIQWGEHPCHALDCGRSLRHWL